MLCIVGEFKGINFKKKELTLKILVWGFIKKDMKNTFWNSNKLIRKIVQMK